MPCSAPCSTSCSAQHENLKFKNHEVKTFSNALKAWLKSLEKVLFSIPKKWILLDSLKLLIFKGNSKFCAALWIEQWAEQGPEQTA